MVLQGSADEQRRKDIEQFRRLINRIGKQLPKDSDLLAQLRRDRDRIPGK